MSGKKLPNDKSQNTITGKHINQSYFGLKQQFYHIIFRSNPKFYSLTIYSNSIHSLTGWESSGRFTCD